jgi:hypothetical protein
LPFGGGERNAIKAEGPDYHPQRADGGKAKAPCCLSHSQVIGQQDRCAKLLAEVETFYFTRVQALQTILRSELSHLERRQRVLLYVAQPREICFSHSALSNSFGPHGIGYVQRLKGVENREVADLRQVDEWTGIRYGAV